MARGLSILIVDDDEDDFFLTSEYLHGITGQSFEISWAPSYDQALNLLSAKNFDLCFFDYLLGFRTGLDLLRVAKELGLRVPIILLTGKGDTEVDVQAIRSGVADYLEKHELDSPKLERSIRYALERAAVHQALQESEEKYRSIFERSLDAICLLDAQGKFTDVNEAAIKMLGFSRSEFLTKTLPDLFRSELTREVFWAKIEQGEGIPDLEVELVAANGKHRICVIVCTCLRMPGNEDTFTLQCIIHDLTRRKKTEQELLRAEKLAATGRFMRTLGHEIRNPLTNIDLATNQLLLENQDTELEDYLEIIGRNSKRIGHLVTALLQTSNPGQLTLRLTSLHELLDQTIEMATDRIALKNIQLTKHFDPKVNVANVDAEKLKIALLNIIINGIEIMEAGRGELTISTSKVHNQICISILDNGPGISREVQNRMFEPYFSNKPNGVGLGLAGALSIIQLHGGNIEVQSEEGKGARFTVWIKS